MSFLIVNASRYLKTLMKVDQNETEYIILVWTVEKQASWFVACA